MVKWSFVLENKFRRYLKILLGRFVKIYEKIKKIDIYINNISYGC